MTGQLEQRLGFDDNVMVEGESSVFMCVYVCVKKEGVKIIDTSKYLIV
jgi:hypothetical protein